MVALTIEKFHHCPFLLVLKRTACYCDHRACWVPLDLAEDHGGVNGDRVLVLVVFHQDQSALLVRDAETHWRLLGVHLCFLEPVDAGQGDAGGEEVFGLNDALQALET